MTYFEHLHIPLSAEAFQELQELQAIIQGIQVQSTEADCWQYVWGSNRYSSKQFYNLPFKNIRPHHHSYGFGNQDAATNLEPSHGCCS